MALSPVTRRADPDARGLIALAVLALAATVSLVPAFPMRIMADALALIQLILQAATG